jgi:uncharacterized protein
MPDKIIRLKPTRPCPICGKPSSQEHHPFCSARCADIDLNRWLSGAYVIPATPEEEEMAADSDVAPSEDEDDDGR